MLGYYGIKEMLITYSLLLIKIYESDMLFNDSSDFAVFNKFQLGIW